MQILYFQGIVSHTYSYTVHTQYDLSCDKCFFSLPTQLKDQNEHFKSPSHHLTTYDYSKSSLDVQEYQVVKLIIMYITYHITVIGCRLLYDHLGDH